MATRDGDNGAIVVAATLEEERNGRQLATGMMDAVNGRTPQLPSLSLPPTRIAYPPATNGDNNDGNLIACRPPMPLLSPPLLRRSATGDDLRRG